MSDHTERGIHADRDHSEEPPRADHGPFCPAFSAPRIGRFRAIETEGPCTCKPFWPAGYAQRVRTARAEASGHTETGEALRGAVGPRAEVERLRTSLGESLIDAALQEESADIALERLAAMTRIARRRGDRVAAAAAERDRLAGVVEQVRALAVDQWPSVGGDAILAILEADAPEASELTIEGAQP